MLTDTLKACHRGRPGAGPLKQPPSDDFKIGVMCLFSPGQQLGYSDLNQL